MSNKLQNTRIEFHILQSFPVSCLNRDDVGSPKNALIGGTQRARVSSQCWKRAVRLAMREFEVTLAKRTRLVTKWIQEACENAGASKDLAEACGNTTAQALTKTVKDGESDTPFYISKAETEAIAQFFKAREFDASADRKELLKILKKGVNTVQDGVDIALFGRMAASALEVNVEAAASFAHAISTHKSASEVEFFTTVDDLKEDRNEQGAAHMGSLEFNAATYYRYISIDLGKLVENLGGSDDLDLTPVIAAFTKALFNAVPSARQTTMSAASMWDYAKILIRRGQRLQASFEEAVKLSKEKTSLAKASREKLDEQLTRIEKLSGSLYGKLAEFTFGEDLSFSIDDLVKQLSAEVRKLQMA